MSKEQIKISTNISKIVKQVKKEHFIKLILTLITSILMVMVLCLVIFSITPFTTGLGEDIAKPLYELIDGSYVIVQEIKAKDANALYVFNNNKENIVLIVSLIGGSGWLAFFSYITNQKNMITPQAIKKTVRKGLQFNYLKQKDVEYISNEIDINIGIKERVENEETLE